MGVGNVLQSMGSFGVYFLCRLQCGRLPSSVRGSVEGIEKVEEDCGLHDAQVVEQVGIASLVLVEEATINAEYDELRELQLSEIFLPPQVFVQSQGGHRVVQVHDCQKTKVTSIIDSPLVTTVLASVVPVMDQQVDLT